MAGDRRSGRGVRLVLAGVGALLIVPGCGGGTSGHAATPVQPSSSPSPGATPSAAPSESGGGASDRCHTPALSAALVMPDAGAGQRYVMIKLTNSSTTTCTIFGYGGMQLADAARAPLPTRLTRVSPPAPHRVTLAPGASAVSQLHWTAVSGTGEPVTGACEPPPSLAQVTPPDETTPLTVPWTMGAVCQHGAVDQQPYH
jgi:Protein of unknown function (DUF4232)